MNKLIAPIILIITTITFVAIIQYIYNPSIKDDIEIIELEQKLLDAKLENIKQKTKLDQEKRKIKKI